MDHINDSIAEWQASVAEENFDPFEAAYEAYLKEEVLPSQYKAISAADLFKRPAPKCNSYVPGFIYAGAINLIAGEPKAGKTTLVWYLLNALTLSKTFLHMETRKTNVLLVTEQNELSFRKKAGDVAGFCTNPAIYILFPEQSKLTKWLDRVAFWDTELTATDSNLLVIDTFLPFADLPPGGENDSATISNRLMELKQLFARRPSLGIVLVHHIRKPSADPKAHRGQYANLRDARGSTAIAGGVDNCVMLSKPDVLTTQRYVHLEGRFDDEKEFTIALTERDGYTQVGALDAFRSPNA
jgi:RecA-family ATPase